jgi:protein involved in polysaccharide export with SLBB domain
MTRNWRVRIRIAALTLLLVSCRAAAPIAPDREAPVTADLARLAALHHTRASAEPQDYPIGPGDLIGISVPAMPEIQDLELRVGADGTIALPLLGQLDAGGRTEQSLRDTLRAKLSEFMYDPQFSLLVKEHRNRRVGVLGAVAKPGLHPLDGPADTVLDLISKAGGLTDDATRRVLLLPRPAAGGPVENVAPEVSAGVAGAAEAGFSNPSIVIDLDRLDGLGREAGCDRDEPRPHRSRRDHRGGRLLVPREAQCRPRIARGARLRRPPDPGGRPRQGPVGCRRGSANAGR